jgi:two-component system sensor histidine kinase PilS (NtrC family)
MAAPEGRDAAYWLALGRAAVAGVLAASLAGAHLTGRLPFPLAPALGVLAAAALLSALSLGLLDRVERPARLAELQIYGDVVLETGLVYLTGGPYSVFPFLYLLSILTAGITVAPRRSVRVATAAVLLHGLLLVATFYRWLPAPAGLAMPQNLAMEGSLTILLVSGNFCASFIVSYVAMHLAGRLRQARGEARRSEATLAELQTLHEDIVESVASGLLTFDRRGLVTSVNRTAEALCLRGAAALLGTPWEQLFAEAPPFAEVWETLERSAARRTRVQAELRRADGSRIPIGMSVSFLRRGRGVIGSFQDLTDIRRMEERVRHADRLAALGRMAAGLAHEIRNPIGSIRGSIEVLRETLAPQGDDRRLMDIVLRESDRLDAIIRDFLQFSGPPGLVRVPTDVGGMLDEILLVLANRAAGEGSAAGRIRLVREDGGAAAKLAVDPGQMRQALWNLCLNAVEAMPEGGELRVGVRELAPERGGPGVEITIADTGLGIAPAALPQIFEPFFTTKAQGTGLGLAIAHRIVEDHGGEIRVESAPGRGSRFTILLPRGEG